MSNVSSTARREADSEQTASEVAARQATETPRNMPVVLIVSTVGAAVALFVVWTVFFG